MFLEEANMVLEEAYTILEEALVALCEALPELDIVLLALVLDRYFFLWLSIHH